MPTALLAIPKSASIYNLRYYLCVYLRFWQAHFWNKLTLFVSVFTEVILILVLMWKQYNITIWEMQSLCISSLDSDETWPAFYVRFYFERLARVKWYCYNRINGILTWLSAGINLAHSAWRVEERCFALRTSVTISRSESNAPKVGHRFASQDETALVLNWKVLNYVLFLPCDPWPLTERIQGDSFGGSKTLLVCSPLLRDWRSSSFMVVHQSNEACAMATKTPVRTAQPPNYALSMCVVPSHSPVVVRRALKTRTDEAQVMFVELKKSHIFNVFPPEMARGCWNV